MANSCILERQLHQRSFGTRLVAALPVLFCILVELVECSSEQSAADRLASDRNHRVRDTPLHTGVGVPVSGKIRSCSWVKGQWLSMLAFFDFLSCDA
jgi:hypothetical protein